MRRIAMVAMVLSAAFLAACTGAGPAPVHGGTQTGSGKAADTTSPPARSPVEGTWRSGRLTRAEILRAYDATGGGTLGSVFVTGPAFLHMIGSGGMRHYAVITLRFQSGYFSDFESADGGPAAQGYTATYRVVGRTLVLTSLQPDPTVCTGIYTFTIRGSQLRLHVRKQCAERHDGPFNTTLFASFPLTKVA